MKKLVRLGDIRRETRSDLIGNVPDGAPVARFGDYCVVPQICIPELGPCFILVTFEAC
jgi:hypothetical protein